MVLVIAYTEDSQKRVLDYIGSHYYPSRFTLILVKQADKSIFPINKLRNIGIRSIETTHFLLFDMDLWPSRTFFESF